MSRREVLLWLAGLSTGACMGVCGLGGLVGVVLGRRLRFQELPQASLPAQVRQQVIPYTPKIVTRVEWNARPINHDASDEKGFASAANPDGWFMYSGDLAAVYATVAIHHSYPIRSDTGTMRQVQDLHIDTRKWADIGYHFGVGRDGTIYEGRDIQVRGSNVAGYNTGTIGVVCIGDYDSEMPTIEQLNALANLVRWLTATYTLTHLAGHYEFNPTTACPGTNLRPYLDDLARVAGLKRGSGGYIAPTEAPGAQSRHAPAQMSGCC